MNNTTQSSRNSRLNYSGESGLVSDGYQAARNSDIRAPSAVAAGYKAARDGVVTSAIRDGDHSAHEASSSSGIVSTGINALTTHDSKAQLSLGYKVARLTSSDGVADMIPSTAIDGFQAARDSSPLSGIKATLVAAYKDARSGARKAREHVGSSLHANGGNSAAEAAITDTGVPSYPVVSKSQLSSNAKPRNAPRPKKAAQKASTTSAKAREAPSANAVGATPKLSLTKQAQRSGVKREDVKEAARAADEETRAKIAQMKPVIASAPVDYEDAKVPADEPVQPGKEYHTKQAEIQKVFEHPTGSTTIPPTAEALMQEERPSDTARVLEPAAPPIETKPAVAAHSSSNIPTLPRRPYDGPTGPSKPTPGMAHARPAAGAMRRSGRSMIGAFLSGFRNARR